MILFIDYNDSFTNNIIKKIFYKSFILNKLNLKINIIKKINYFEKIYIFGPGPSNPLNSNLSTLILDKCIGKKFLIGICLGHQIINKYFGSKYIKTSNPKHGEIQNIIFFNFKKKFFYKKRMIRYNSLFCLNNIYLKIIGISFLEIYYTIKKKLKIKSFQFHPESILSYNNNIL